ncbi:alpha-1D adrenergic receptor isoform X1 [Stegostoma tigrinum]|uniref:alpha-1D adrenergic receptor isoform X1 n=1 Tax=Stegostoma tigrinum TaxID=3053191 RepID=UPI00202B73AE|nr:alpha-1D adrenergic receptor isoform X1 [Stegostoma tigrinum]
MTWEEWTNRSVDGNGSGGAGNRSSEEGAAGLDGVAVGVVLGALIAFAIAGNILVILSVACNRHLQTVTNYFIVNLAVADLLLSATILPFSASLEVFGYWAFGRPFCDVWAAVDVLCCTASIMSLCTISIDRYIGVRYSLRYPAIMTERKAVWILLLLWLSSLVISVGPLLGWKEPAPADDTLCSITEEPGYALFSSLFSFYLPLTVILAMYCRIYVVARRTTRSLEAGVKRERGGNSTELVLRIHCRSAAGPGDEPASTLRARGQAPPPLRSSLSMRLLKFSREKKAAKTVGIVVGVFVLCWLPFFTILPLGAFFPSIKPSDVVFKVIFWLGYFNSCINPIIYPCSSKEFKRAFIRLLKCQCRKRRRPPWRMYAHRDWRSSTYSSERGSEADVLSRSIGSCRTLSVNSSFALSQRHRGSSTSEGIGGGSGASRTLSLHGWKFFPSLSKSPFQLREKMNNLSNKIRMGQHRPCASAASKVDIVPVESISIGVCQEFKENTAYQIYEVTDCFGLKETDI